jgi:hypothetical protein
VNGDDLRRDSFAVRKATLASLVARAAPPVHLRRWLPRSADASANDQRRWLLDDAATRQYRRRRSAGSARVSKRQVWAAIGVCFLAKAVMALIAPAAR